MVCTFVCAGVKHVLPNSKYQHIFFWKDFQRLQTHFVSTSRRCRGLKIIAVYGPTKTFWLRSSAKCRLKPETYSWLWPTRSRVGSNFKSEAEILPKTTGTGPKALRPTFDIWKFVGFAWIILNLEKNVSHSSQHQFRRIWSNSVNWFEFSFPNLRSTANRLNWWIFAKPCW